MYTKKNHRRQFLKLASSLLAAPLGSMGNFARAQTSTGAPLRLLTVIDHFGVPLPDRNSTWIRSPSGDYALQPDDLGSILSQLSNFRENMLVLSNMNLESSIRTGSRVTHAGFVHHTLGASRPNNEQSSNARIPHASIDFRIGEFLNEQNNRPHPHLFFTDYTERNEPTYCYNNSGVLIRSASGGQSAADRTFGSTNVEVDELQTATQQDVLEKVSSRVQALNGAFNNTSDNFQEKLDAYDESVSTLATQLEQQATASCELPDGFSVGGSGRNTSSGRRDDVLQVVGHIFRCNLASAVTYQFGGELMNQHSHNFLGGSGTVRTLLRRNFHSASHRNDDAAIETHRRVRVHQAQIVRNLLNTLAATTDVDGSSVLDNTVVFLPTCMARNTHQRTNYAQAIIAGNNTNLIGGMHYDIGGRTNNELLVTIAQGLNMPITEHGGFRNNGSRVNSLNNGPIEKMLKTTLG